jgi:hypothetical protein
MKNIKKTTWFLVLLLLSPFAIIAQSVFPIVPGSSIASGNDNQVLRNWLESYGNTPSGELIYRRSTNGSSANAFHNSVDEKGPTIVIMRANNGQVFGGYSNNSWSSSSPGYKNSSQAFLFNLNTDRKATPYYPQYSIYTNYSYGPTFGGGHDIYINSSMNSGYFNVHSYNSIDGSAHRSSTALKALTGINTTSTYSSFGAGFITEIEVYKIKYNSSDPIILGQDVSVVLDTNGQASISISEIDNGSYDGDGSVTLSIDQNTFDCESLGGNSSAIQPQFVGSQSQQTHSHGGGYNPNTDEFLYPQWANPSINKYNADHNSSGTMSTGQNQMMQVWMDTDDANSYYTANWGYSTITKRSGSSTIWSHHIGTTAAAVSTDADNVYAIAWGGTQIRVLNKNTGAFVRNINLPGRMYSYGGMVVANNYIYFAGYAYGWGTNQYNWAYIHQLNMDGTYVGSTSTGRNAYNTAFDGETIWVADNGNTINGVKISDGNAYGGSGSNAVTLTATDIFGNTASDTFKVVVIDNIAPTFNLNGDTTINTIIGEAFVDPSGTTADNCTAEVEITGTVNVNVLGTYTLNYKAVDIAGNESQTVSRTVKVVVADSEPPIVITKNIEVELDENGEATITPDDIDNGSTDNEALATEPFSIDINSFNCDNLDNEGGNTVTLTVTDINGNVGTGIAIVTVADKIAPTIESKDIAVLLDATGSVSITDQDVFVSGSDNCSELSYSISQDTFVAEDAINSPVTIQLIGTDSSGNNTSVPAIITVTAPAPNAICQPFTVALDSEGNVIITPEQIDNGSNSVVGIDSLAIDITEFNCEDIGENTVELTVTDVIGNSSTCTAIVTIEDNAAPSVITQDIEVVLDENGSGTIEASQIDDGSSDNCTIASLELDISTFDCSNVGGNVVTLTVTDVNGNDASETANVTIIDSSPPTVITQDIQVVLDENGSGTIETSQIDDGSTDNCAIASLELDISTFDCSNVGNNVVTLTVTDINGNDASETATVTVIDNAAPTVEVSFSAASSKGKIKKHEFVTGFSAVDACDITSVKAVILAPNLEGFKTKFTTIKSGHKQKAKESISIDTKQNSIKITAFDPQAMYQKLLECGGVEVANNHNIHFHAKSHNMKIKFKNGLVESVEASGLTLMATAIDASGNTSSESITYHPSKGNGKGKGYNKYVEESIKIYPNPTKGTFKISLDNNEEDVTIQLYNSSGNLINEQIMSEDINTLEFGHKKAPSGFYTLKVITSGYVYTRIVIVK